MHDNILWEESDDFISIPERHSLLDVHILRLLFSGFIRRSLNDHIIPINVLYLCCDYFRHEFSSIYDLKEEGPFTDQLMINDSDEYLFHSLYLIQTAITGNASTLKLGVAHDLTLDADSDISCRSDGGTIILNVGGHIHLKKDSVIQSRRNGNIYIKCKSMSIEKNAMIRTHHYSLFTASTLMSNPMAINHHLDGDDRDTMFGNIWIITEEALCICPGVQIQSGNIHLDCRGTLKMNYTTDSVLTQSAQITAFRDCLKIDAVRYYSPFPDEEPSLLFTARNRMEIEYGDRLKEDYDPEAKVIDVVVEGLLGDGVSMESETSSSIISCGGLSDLSDEEGSGDEEDLGLSPRLLRGNNLEVSSSGSNSSFKRQDLKITIGP